jgi:hypothetical protein
LAREIGDPWLIANTLYRDACTIDLTRVGDLAPVQAAAEESLALFQAVGDVMGIACAQRTLGGIALHGHDLDRARMAYEAALAAMRAVGDLGGVHMALDSLGEIARRRGDCAGALAFYREGLALISTAPIQDETWALALFLDGLAAVVVAQGRPQRAAYLLGSADAVRQATTPRWPERELVHQAAAHASRAALGEAAFAAAWAEGQALSLEQAVAYALADEPEVSE